MLPPTQSPQAETFGCDIYIQCNILHTYIYVTAGEAQMKSFVLIMRWIVLRPGIELAGDGTVVWQVGRELFM